MRAIAHKNTRPELLVRGLLHRRGFRFRLHVRTLAGSPDLVFPMYNAAVFINGCFLHGHNCHLFKIPETRPDFWAGKIEANRARDSRAVAALASEGWRVLTIWECAIKGRLRLPPEALADDVAAWLRAQPVVPDFSVKEIQCSKAACVKGSPTS